MENAKVIMSVIFFVLAAILAVSLFFINKTLKQRYSENEKSWKKTFLVYSFWACLIFAIVFVIAGFATVFGNNFIT
ncbi:hypothetical protein ACA758_04925 [Mycoplasmopsis agassizii]|uniref:Uncharacterized protein n=1 Tax=Mycoplasmopsis agassizii TaxID=33922 RepID=A0A1W1WZI0_9BACT|nr:hypothetical protein [Mycoplasmopsis agassizii]PAF54920.1 hypothetical protein CJF60_04250 [Mycoplasmopsis agassizii]PAK21769.1 hypothetical protein CJJ23_00285 [Mycoplasmopsis agassizii]SMC17142.1 hypothetical protein SAMN02745179_00402 [Mycoplasmopsis agassizii]